MGEGSDGYRDYQTDLDILNSTLHMVERRDGLTLLVVTFAS